MPKLQIGSITKGKTKTPNLPQFKAKAFKGVVNKLPRKSGRKK